MMEDYPENWVDKSTLHGRWWLGTHYLVHKVKAHMDSAVAELFRKWSDCLQLYIKKFFDLYIILHSYDRTYKDLW